MMFLANSDIVREVDRAFTLIGWASIILLAGVTLAMVFFVVRYRRSTTRNAAQIEGHLGLEITWIVIPTILVTWMFFVGYRGFLMMRTVPDDAMVVEVTGRQWAWSFRYPVEKLDTSMMVVPVNRAIRVNLTAPPEDVAHSFYIPDFRVKEDVVPGMDTYLWFEADKVGTYNIFCAEFCGKDHSKMLSILEVVSQEDYDAWVEAQRAKRYLPLEYAAFTDAENVTFSEDGLNIRTAALYSTFCTSCHGDKGDGSGLPGEARDFANPSEEWTRSERMVDIYRTLTEGVDGTQMRAYPNLTPWERVALAHYVTGFMADPGEITSEAEYGQLVEEYKLDEVEPPKRKLSIDRAMEILSDEAGQ